MSSYKRYDDVDIPDDFVMPEANQKRILRGQALFKKHCSQCHTIRRDGVNPYGTLWGPNLYGIIGRTAGQNARTGWATYSRAVEGSGILWTERNLVAFLKNPRAFAGGVINMNFRGIDSIEDRVDLVHYMKRAGHENWMAKGTPHTQKKWWTRTEGRDKKPTESIWSTVSGMFTSVGEQTAEQKAEILACSAEVQSWKSVAQVTDGVRPASVQSGMNWPPPEVIAAGNKPRRAKPQAQATEQGTQATAAGAVACEERPLGAGLPPGERMPSGLMLYRELPRRPPA